MIILLGLLVYFPALFFNFTYLDDNILIMDNYNFLHKFSNIFTAFKQHAFFMTSGPDAYYRPLLTASFAIDAQLGPFSFFRYHLTNIAIHILSACLVFLFFIKLKYHKNLSLFFSLVFAVHPILSQAVAWVPGRNDSLLAVFVLLSFIFLVKFLENKKWKNYFFHFLFFAAALFTKESAIVLPVLVILYFWIFHKTKCSHSEKYKLVFSWIGIFLIWFFLRQSALAGSNTLKMNILEIGESIWLGLPAVVQYLGKIIFPFNLSVVPLIKDTSFIYGIIAIILLIIAFLISKQKRLGVIAFGLVWFLIFLLPSFIRPNPGIFADFMEHRIYLPIIGFFIFLMELEPIKRIAAKKVFACLIIIILSVITLFHLPVFKNRMNFWQNAVKNSPHSTLAHRNLGAMYYLDGFLDKAEAEYLGALNLNPAEQMVHNNLGLIYMDQGQFPEAEKEFAQEAKINPLYDNVYYNWGLLYYKLGKTKEAEALWLKTIELNPNYIDAFGALIVYYYEQKDFPKAVYYVKELQRMGIQINPELLKALGI